MPSAITVTFVLLLLLAVSVELFHPSSMPDSVNKPWVVGSCVLTTTPQCVTKYATTWYRFVKSHHDDEEAELFPKVEEVRSAASRRCLRGLG
jgi:hypothetical protein